VDKTIEQMGQDLALGGYAVSTRASYCTLAQELVEYVGKPVVEITREQIRAFVDATMARPLSMPSKLQRFCALRFLYRKTLGQPEMVSFIKAPKVHPPLPVVLSPDEVYRLLYAICDPCYRAMAMVMYGAGLRITEVTSLKVSDIDGARGVIRVHHGKGGKPREAKLSPSLYQWLRRYWAQMRPPTPYLFVNDRGGTPFGPTVRRALKKAAQRAGITKRVTPHALRHSFATHLLEEGADIRVVGALLGHASLSTTTRYARVTEKLVREAPSPLDLLPQPHR
jgi:site-specific recombinase XerD